MRLLLYHPEYAARPCEDCAKWMYQEDGSRKMFRGLPMLRPQGVPTPCWKCPKIPADAPVKARSEAVEMSEQSRAVWLHYSECRAVGQFPDDPIVRRHAGLIRRIEDAHARNTIAGRLDSIITLLGARGG